MLIIEKLIMSGTIMSNNNNINIQPGIICDTNLLKPDDRIYDRIDDRINIFVIDMDETLGYFTEIAYFCNLLENYYVYNEHYIFKEYLTIQHGTISQMATYVLSDEHFFNVLHTFFMCIRPSMFTILLRVFLSKKSAQDKVVLYTNNQWSKTWCERIVRFFEHHFRENYTNNGGKLFDDIIAAYKINDVQIDMRRTRHEKCVSDLITCLGLPTNASGVLSNRIRILFMDDIVHEQMIHPNVKYILCKPYVYCYDYKYMVDAYYNIFMRDIHTVHYINNNDYKTRFTAHMLSCLSSSGYIRKSNDDYPEQVWVSLKIIDEVKRFYME
jgi:hypothetical protein